MLWRSGLESPKAASMRHQSFQIAGMFVGYIHKSLKALEALRELKLQHSAGSERLFTQPQGFPVRTSISMRIGTRRAPRYSRLPTCLDTRRSRRSSVILPHLKRMGGFDPELPVTPLGSFHLDGEKRPSARCAVLG